MVFALVPAGDEDANLDHQVPDPDPGDAAAADDLTFECRTRPALHNRANRSVPDAVVGERLRLARPGCMVGLWARRTPLHPGASEPVVEPGGGVDVTDEAP